MISSDTMRGYNDIILLSLLLNQASYGYELSRQIRERTEGLYSIKETTLYSAFERLLRSGYIVSFFGEESFGKRRTYYRITPKGRAYYFEKCEEWELTKTVISKFVINQRGI